MKAYLNTTTIKICKRYLMYGIKSACPFVVNAPLTIIFAHKAGLGAVNLISDEGYNVSQYFIYSEYKKLNSTKIINTDDGEFEIKHILNSITTKLNQANF